MNNKLVGIFVFYLTLLVSINSANAKSIKALIANNQLIITTEVQAKELQIVGQPLTISIEVATKRWFAKGTSIQSFKLTDTVILPNNDMTINGTKRINNETWTTQVREVIIYPTRAGDFELPAIAINISVNTENDGMVAGIAMSSAQAFTISLPDELANIEHYVVSPAFTIEVDDDFSQQQNDDSRSREYTIGEAITQTITLTASNTPAMMLPPIKPAQLLGISIYQKPSKVFDQANRGQLTGTRVESFTYIFEQAGNYKIPRQIIYWWNSNTNELNEVIIAEQQWTVSNNVISTKSNLTNVKFSFKTEYLKYSVLLIVILCSLFSINRYKRQIFALYSQFTQLETRKLKKHFLTEIAQENYRAACQQLTQYYQLPPTEVETLKQLFGDYPEQLILLNKLYQLAFSEKESLIATEKITINNAKKLLLISNKLKTLKASNTNKKVLELNQLF